MTKKDAEISQNWVKFFKHEMSFCQFHSGIVKQEDDLETFVSFMVDMLMKQFMIKENEKENIKQYYLHLSFYMAMKE